MVYAVFVEFFFKKTIDFLWHKLYNLIVAQKVGEKVSPRTGRPKVENPLTVEVKARIDVETNKKLVEYCKKNKVTRTEVVREGIVRVLNAKK